MDKFIEVSGISMNYHSGSGETRAIKDVSFDVKKGEFVSIIGPSGCGKSTLLSIIAGLLKPSSGNVRIGGRAVRYTRGEGGRRREAGRPGCSAPAEQARGEGNVGLMLQRDCLFEWRNVYENAVLGLELLGKLTAENKGYVNELLEQFGLSEFKKYKPHELSGGMRQRVALIRTLACRPELLLLDEPFSALDYQTRLYIADEVGRVLKKEGKTAVLVTHDISEAVSLSDRIIVLTKRPSVINNVHNIVFGQADRTAQSSREAPEFRTYFNKIWKELDVRV